MRISTSSKALLWRELMTFMHAIRQCRSKLRECGRFAWEDFIFLDPLVTDEDVAEEGEVEVVDEPSVEGVHVDVGGDCT
ncbi:UNVERIFIED_CONTAM: hypothetical protein Slati_2164400 [Sesamum latifolium]|uniref:Uncharacterized protein n=1 Tax=Sesamum latifolium TaxID=2727402 RepID=A0AAW2WRC6_9LAMI